MHYFREHRPPGGLTQDTVSSNVSDHYPIKLSYERVAIFPNQHMSTGRRSTKIYIYAALVQERLECVSTGASAVYDVEKAVQTVNQVLAESADESAPKRQRHPRRAKSSNTSCHLQQERSVLGYIWKAAGRSLIVQKKATTNVLRQICRRENAHQSMPDKQDILDVKSQDTALFFRLVYKHRCKSGVHLNELHQWRIQRGFRGFA